MPFFYWDFWVLRPKKLCELSVAPDFVSDLFDQSQFRPLLLFRQIVSFFGRSEAALRAQA
jgi:hypothetical protein